MTAGFGVSALMEVSASTSGVTSKSKKQSEEPSLR